MAQTDPLASGASTSEGKLTIAMCLVGGALEAFAGVLSQASEQHPSSVWMAIALVLVGAGIQVFTVLGYTKSRSALKSNAIVQALAAGVPLMVTAIGNAVLKNVKDAAGSTAPAQALATNNLQLQAMKQVATATGTVVPPP